MKAVVYLLALIFFLILLFMFSGKNDISLLLNPLATFGLITLGAYISAFTARRAGLVVPRYYAVALQGLLGGLLMGIGFVVAGLPELPNNLMMVHGVFYWVSLLMPQGFIYLGGVLLGGGAAVLLQKFIYPRVSFTVVPDGLQKGIRRYAAAVYITLGVLVLLAGARDVTISGKLGLSLLGAAAALTGGFLLERNRFCMGLMMKELYFTRARGTLFKFAAVLLALGGTWVYFGIGKAPANVPDYWLTAVGSFCMGFGFIVADGCYMGSLWKAGQGNLASLLAIIGIFFGAGTAGAIKNSGVNVVVGTPVGLNGGWPVLAIKIGLVFFMLVWVGAYFVERPQAVVKRGSKKIWLLSEAAILLTLLMIAVGRGNAFSGAVKVIGAVIYYLGIALYIWARVCLGKYWGEAIVLRADHKIVTSGPYRYFKHPIYIGIALGLTGAALLLGSLWGLLATWLLTVPSLILRGREEERILNGLPGAETVVK